GTYGIEGRSSVLSVPTSESTGISSLISGETRGYQSCLLIAFEPLISSSTHRDVCPTSVSGNVIASTCLGAEQPSGGLSVSSGSATQPVMDRVTTVMAVRSKVRGVVRCIVMVR